MFKHATQVDDKTSDGHFNANVEGRGTFKQYREACRRRDVTTPSSTGFVAPNFGRRYAYATDRMTAEEVCASILNRYLSFYTLYIYRYSSCVFLWFRHAC